jgi:hypothetical protein
MDVTSPKHLPFPRSRQAGQSRTTRQAHEHGFHDVIQMMSGGDHPQAQRRALLRKEIQAGCTQVGFGGETDCTPLADDVRDVKGHAQGLHEARIVLRGLAPHAVVEVEDAQPWPQRFVCPQGQQEVDGIRATRHGYPNELGRQKSTLR